MRKLAEGVQVPGKVRRRLAVAGIVQGVGFRPFIWRRATRLGLAGFVTNAPGGVVIELEGPSPVVDRFVAGLAVAAPPLAAITAIESTPLPVRGDAEGFAILSSSTDGPGSTSLPADVATCPTCLAELRDPADRRHGHPFITCTDCGPRFTIITALPYDRAATTMRSFAMCAACAAEYDDPASRRYHAQPIACPNCGPAVWYADAACRPCPITRPESGLLGPPALARARDVLLRGGIVAVKGIGGFHLACDATQPAAVATLRRRKGRSAKPLAVMVADVATAETIALVDEQERRLLTAASAPIVLLRRRPAVEQPLASEVAPDSGLVGLLLAYSPLHQLLVAGMPPLVMTSGNLADEPIVHDNAAAAMRVAPLCDGLLLHDRDIAVACDDSVVRCAAGAPLLVRRSRGCAPLPVRLPARGPDLLAAGGDLKSVVGLAHEDRLVLSQHLGDAVHPETLTAMTAAADHLTGLWRARPEAVVVDLHPGYLSGGWGRRCAAARGIPVIEVQHHEAHAAALAIDIGWPTAGPTARPLVVACGDGTGYGTDGTIWGGEFFLLAGGGVRRVASLAEFPLPGGDACARHPWRTALAVLHAAGIAWDDRLPCAHQTTPTERIVLARQLDRGVHCIGTSSLGRLFDAVAAVLGVAQENRYEAEAAMRLEAIAATASPPPGPGMTIVEAAGLLRVDWRPVVRWIVERQLAGEPPARLAARFHEAVAEMIVAVALQLRPHGGGDTIGLTGGVFQNALLVTRTSALLRHAGLEAACHHAVPPNDGGLAVGQLALARWRMG